MPFLVLTDSEGNPIDKDLKNIINEEINPSSSMGKSENSDKYIRYRKEEKKRFIERESEFLSMAGYRIIVDSMSGVNYLENSFVG
ncbi:hypothetical protein ACX92S_13570 (plasmid) [Enterococcus faecalis]